MMPYSKAIKRSFASPGVYKHSYLGQTLLPGVIHFRRPLVLPFVAILCVLAVSCNQRQTPNKQTASGAEPVIKAENYQLINNNLDNFSIRRACEDLEAFRRDKKPVYSIRHYKAGRLEDGQSAEKKVGAKNFYLQSYTEYLKDGRKRYQAYSYDHAERIENYHYDPETGNLLLIHRVEPEQDQEKNHYNILSYRPDGLLREEIGYRSYKGTDFDLERYTAYRFNRTKNAIRVSISDIGHDSIPAPAEAYTFEANALIKQKPLFQSKKQYFKLMNGIFKPVKTEGYIFDDRNVAFTYNDKGFITSETWIKNGELEDKKEFAYSDDYREHIQQDYHQRGTEKSARHIRKYNTQGDLIFEQMIEYTGNALNPVVFAYVYDKNGNWTERKKFRLNGATRTLAEHELREIIYFEAGSKVRNIPFPPLSEKAAQVAATLPKAARKKQLDIDAFNKAVGEGNYDTEITRTKAREIKDFTPKFWKLKATAFGDLDKLPGDEAVAVFETPLPDDLGFKQMLAIFRRSGNQWILWHQSAAPVLGTQGGGAMGNPFEDIRIANRAIAIDHFGGSRQKWRYRHIYRFQQNDWHLIGAGVHFGAPCDYFVDLDYNLSTGEGTAAYAQEICDHDTREKAPAKSWKKQFSHKASLPKMDEFVPGENKFAVPGMDEEIYY